MTDPETASPNVDGDAPCVLLVEDDKAVAAFLCFLLEREGYRVEQAADGRAALQLIDTMQPPALAMLDIMLPYVDGFELIAAIRAHPAWEDVPLLMLSAKGSEKDITRALDAGADDYMLKPFQPDVLKARLRRLLRKKA